MFAKANGSTVGETFIEVLFPYAIDSNNFQQDLL